MTTLRRYSTIPSTLRLAFSLVLLGSGAAHAQRHHDYNRDSRTSIDTTFGFDSRGMVSLTLGSGDIVVTTWSRDQIRIHATSENGGLRLDASDSRVSLELNRGGDSRFEVT